MKAEPKTILRFLLEHYDAIAELSTAEKNYLKDGYWAANRASEMKPSSLYVRFFVRMDDCSKRILSVVKPGMSEAEREKAINQEIAKIEKENADSLIVQPNLVENES